MRTFKIGIAEYRISSSPDVLKCLGLGSCVAVGLYDPNRRVGGLAHIMLPNSSEIRSSLNRSSIKAGKFADTAISVMLQEMIKLRVKKEHMSAKIVGGASMFSGNGSTDESLFKMGERNVLAVKEQLKMKGINILAEDTGGTYGRSIDFQLDSGILIVKSKKGIIEL